MQQNAKKGYFSKIELTLLISSIVLIIISFLLFDRENYLNLILSLVGVTSLIFCAKGNPVGQFLMLIFSALYGVVSYSFRYYGEMITYLGMTAPMALFSLITWLRNPYNGNKSQVKVNRISKKEAVFMVILSLAVTIGFYFILLALGTNNMIFSAISVTTSFIGAYLTFRRSPYYALGYAFNDIVLIVLWILASMHDTKYISVIVCFVAFLVNDLYGFFNWLKMQKSQREKI